MTLSANDAEPEPTTSEIDIKLQCMAQAMGVRLGDILRIIVQCEMRAAVKRIEQLQALLDGKSCIPQLSGGSSPGDTTPSV